MSNMTIEQMQKEFEEAITPNKGFKNLWELKGVKEFKLANGIAWTGALVYRGLVAGTVECRGDGGCYYYSFGSKGMELQFERDVKAAYEGREMVDVEEDCFTNYLDLAN